MHVRHGNGLAFASRVDLINDTGIRDDWHREPRCLLERHLQVE
jgi:hypothetical protein